MFAAKRQIAELRKILNRLRLVVGRFAVNHAANHPFADGMVVDHVFFNQPRNHVSLDVRVKHMRAAVELNVHERLLGAHADATDADDLRREFVLGDFLFDGLKRFARPGCNAASAHADINHGASFRAGGECLLKFFAERRQVVE